MADLQGFLKNFSGFMKMYAILTSKPRILKRVFPICSQGSVHLTLSVPQFEGPTVGSRSKGDLNAL